MQNSILIKLSICFLTTFVFYGKAQGASEPTSIWEAVDIIPMPKEIKPTNNNLVLNPENTSIVIGQEPLLQSQIGANWINQRLAEFGNAPALPIITGSELPDGKTYIIIGTISDNPLIAKAAKDKFVNVGANNPGERGYEIRRSTDGKKIYLAGADNIGALYACVTFGELLKQQGNSIAWQSAEIRDWPDTIYTCMGDDQVGGTITPELARLTIQLRNTPEPSAKLREEYLSTIKKFYDWLLRRKITLLQYCHIHAPKNFKPQQNYDIIREGAEYGKERGIGAFFHSFHPFVGLRKDYPELEADALPPGRYPEWIRSWGMDDVRKRTAENLAEFIKAVGYTDVQFHDTDTGGLDNPAQWNERSEADRRRWGDDYAAATIHKHLIYYNAIKAIAPDTRIYLVFYPYILEILDQGISEKYLAKQYGGDPSAFREMAQRYREKYSEFWRQLHVEMPPDIGFCMREVGQEAVDAFHTLIPGRPVSVFNGLVWQSYQSFFSETPRWSASYCHTPHDLVWVRYGDQVLPLQSLAVREYTWNKRTPGNGTFGQPPKPTWQRCDPEGEIYNLILPRILRNIFGRQAAPEIMQAIGRNIQINQIFNQLRRSNDGILKSSIAMTEQAEQAKAGATAIDKIWTQYQADQKRMGMDDYAFLRLIYLREVLHGAKWMAAIRSQHLLARELAMQQDRHGAEQAINRGLELTAQAEQDGRQLLRDRPSNNNLSAEGLGKGTRRWRNFMADEIDWAKTRELLIQTSSEIEELCAVGGVPPVILEKLTKPRTVRALRINETLALDGNLSEDFWQRACPIETFLVIDTSNQIARAHTRGRLVYNDKNLYLGFEAWPSAGTEGVTDKDAVELFICPPKWKNDDAHFFIYPTGKLRQQRGRHKKQNGSTTWDTDNEWHSNEIRCAVKRATNFWSGELIIPFQALEIDPPDQGAQPLQINLTRSCPLAESTESSSILAAGAKSFREHHNFAAMQWDPPEAGFVSEAEINVSNLRLETRTLPRTIATVAGFNLSLKANQVLHNLTIKAETYNAAKHLETSQIIAQCNRVFYEWSADERLEAVFDTICETGAVHLLAKSDEMVFEHWIRFGGWTGNEKIGAMFAPGIAGTTGLAGACHFPDRVKIDDELVPLLNATSGTMEFWVQPIWRGYWLAPYSKTEIRTGAHTFLHYGPIRKNESKTANNSPLAILHSDEEGSLMAVLRAYHINTGYNAIARIRNLPEWQPGQWRHIALVWDAQAEQGQKVRLYLDGIKRANGVVHRPDRMPPDGSNIMETVFPFYIQIGAQNNGLQTAKAVIDILRLSRSVRYRENFTPQHHEPELDTLTTAQFAFNNSLEGQGMTTNGKIYSIMASAGTIAQ